ncbi:MAG TPA: hypothetical protein PKY87_18720, partial [Terricaulis sp.]|nr:hypothetical protein [Terricaulis sp.]
MQIKQRAHARFGRLAHCFPQDDFVSEKIPSPQLVSPISYISNSSSPRLLLIHLLAASVPLRLSNPDRAIVMENNAAMQGPDGPSIAQEAIDLMRLHGVPPSGPNYQVWLTYRLGAHRPLCEAIDARISGGEGFSEEFSEDLYERFFTGLGASAQIVLAGEKIARDLGQVVSFLRATEEKSGDYGRTLETAATHLDRGVGPEQIRQIV